MTDYIGLDFETYSGCDLTVHGLERYVQDPTFRPLIVSGATPGGKVFTWDFVDSFDYARGVLKERIKGRVVVAHNKGFEFRVLQWLELEGYPAGYEDSALSARVHGGSGSLAMASRQFLPQHKMEEGRDLIRLFSIPGKKQEKNGSLHFDPSIVTENEDEWKRFKKYCELDAKLSLTLRDSQPVTPRELSFESITFRMNQIGWPVDRDVVEEMYARFLENQAAALNQFAIDCNASDLNLNSLKQMKEWCGKRGIKAASFDEKHVEKMHAALVKKLAGMLPNDVRWEDYKQVLELLQIKKILGGSSPKKLKVILDTIAPDKEGVWRLKDQYIHAGAPQTQRTTGRSVQMQNLKRLDSSNIADMEKLFDPHILWSNDELAQNLRQCFTSRQKNGFLIVGDFSSIESRGLAYQAGAHWKLDAFRNGRDMYKVLAEQIYHVHYDDVLKAQRQTGKVGELSCGYGAGGPAVQAFAEGMGVEMNEAEAAKLVSDWRKTNPEIEDYWLKLDVGLHLALEGKQWDIPLHDGSTIRLAVVKGPDSLRSFYPKAMTLVVRFIRRNGGVYFTRYFHGAHIQGRNVRYFKPSKKKAGEAWVNSYVDPKTKQRKFYELYGGKLAGIMTQSLCREIFMDQLEVVDQWMQGLPNIQLIGQFHDEIVSDWVPGDVSLQSAVNTIRHLMSQSFSFPDFPMAAEVKYDYRYTK